jgi:Holliday junction resolvase RusA-like endonuclease
VIIIDVLGTPAPKGSSRAFVNRKTGGAIMAPGGSKVNQERIKSWSAAVREAALEAIGERAEPVFVRCCVFVEVVFYIARPAGHWGKGKNAGRILPSAPPAPLSKPDGDKLLRTTWDALTGLAFDDDSRIVDWVGRKRWAEPGSRGRADHGRGVEGVAMRCARAATFTWRGKVRLSRCTRQAPDSPHVHVARQLARPRTRPQLARSHADRAGRRGRVRAADRARARVRRDEQGAARVPAARPAGEAQARWPRREAPRDREPRKEGRIENRARKAA